MTRDDLITAIAADINSSFDHLTGREAAISAIATIEALGFVIVPRVPDAKMIKMYADLPDVAARTIERMFAELIAASPLYRDMVKG